MIERIIFMSGDQILATLMGLAYLLLAYLEIKDPLHKNQARHTLIYVVAGLAMLIFAITL